MPYFTAKPKCRRSRPRGNPVVLGSVSATPTSFGSPRLRGRRHLVFFSFIVALSACKPTPITTTEARPLGLPAIEIPASNPKTQAKIDLGRKLFMDRRLSFNNTMSCAMCHVPEQGFVANEFGGAIGLEGHSLRRNAPTILNVAYVRQLFHDGRETSLEQQAWGPLLNPLEMGNPSVDYVSAKIKLMPDYANKFEAAFAGQGPNQATVGAAIANYERTLISGNSRFDRWHFGGDQQAMSKDEQDGYAVFNGKGRCSSCHTVGEKSALFSDGQFHNTGIGWERNRVATSGQARRYKVRLAEGVYTEVDDKDLRNVSEPLEDDLGRFEVSKNPADRWAYRTPNLRNIALTGLYMHDGSLSTLEEVIEFYQRGGINNPQKDKLLMPLQLSAEDKRNLLAFLRCLNGDNVDRLAAKARSEAIDFPIPEFKYSTAK